MKRTALIFLLILGRLQPVGADAGHEIKIEELNLAIAAHPDMRDLYYSRAGHYRELAKVTEARADLEKCLTIDPGYLPAIRELARLDDAAGGTAAAIARMEKAIATAEAAPDLESQFHLVGCYSLLAQLLLKTDRAEAALQAVIRGTALSQEVSTDLVLLKSEIQRRMGLKKERVRDLEAAMISVRAYLIRQAWIEAMIDAGDNARTLVEIQLEIESNRLISSWLIRRARVFLQTGKQAEAATDLQAARAEIGTRLRIDSPDPTLLCDLASIEALEGNAQECARLLAEARKHKADECFLRVPASLLAALPAPATSPAPAK